MFVPLKSARFEPLGRGIECQPQCDIVLNAANVCSPVMSAEKANSPFPTCAGDVSEKEDVEGEFLSTIARRFIFPLELLHPQEEKKTAAINSRNRFFAIEDVGLFISISFFIGVRYCDKPKPHCFCGGIFESGI